jgi:hypothetical protein
MQVIAAIDFSEPGSQFYTNFAQKSKDQAAACVLDRYIRD